MSELKNRATSTTGLCTGTDTKTNATVSVYPMTDVAIAIETVLKETSRILVEYPRLPITVPTSTSTLLGHTLATNVCMKQPGYPPYHISIMDGYAINCSDAKQFYQQQEQHQQQQQDELSSPNSIGDIIESKNNSNSSKDSSYWTHIVKEKIYTGDTIPRPLFASENTSSLSQQGLLPAYYVTTGAVVPHNCDCVVPIEDVFVKEIATRSEDTIDMNQSVIFLHIPYRCIVPNQWIRLPGSDIAPNTVVVPRNHIIDYITLGLILQSGHTNVSIRRPVTVGILSTGNELISPRQNRSITATSSNSSSSINTDDINDGTLDEDWWIHAKKGMIPDVNKPVLIGLIQSWNNTTHTKCNIIDLGICRDDDIHGMTQIFQTAIGTCDVIITTGGISVGETDIVEQVLLQQLHGTIHFGRLNMKPGKPTTFVTVPRSSNSGSGSTSNSNDHTKAECIVFALPGNPASAVTCTHLLVRPCLDLLYEGEITHYDMDDDDNNNDNHAAITSNNSTVDDDKARKIEQLVSNAYVQPELYATLGHDIKLDYERPEYHRVRIIQQQSMVSSSTTTTTNNNSNSTNSNGTEQWQHPQAISTGMQRSSRLASMLDANGLMVLPKATSTHPIAKKGETYLVIRHDDQFKKEERVPFCLSNHKRQNTVLLPSPSSTTTVVPTNAQLSVTSSSTTSASLRVRIVQTVRYANDRHDSFVCGKKASEFLSERIQKALNHPTITSNGIVVIGTDVYSDPIDQLVPYLVKQQSLVSAAGATADLIVLVCPDFVGSYLYHLQVGVHLRTRLEKIADTFALEIRKHSTIATTGESAVAAAATFETVVGYLPSPPSALSLTSNNDGGDRTGNGGAIVVYVSEHGMESGFGHVRGLLKYASKVAQGKST